MSNCFNLEAAKNGAPVRTRGGSPARIVCFDAQGPEPLIVLLRQDDPDMETYGNEEAWHYCIGGKFNSGEHQMSNSLDLVMA